MPQYPSCSPSFSSSPIGRRRYPPGEPIAVSWTDAPGNTWDWIGVYPLGGDTEGADPLAYRFTDARPAGTTTIPVALERGRYLVGLFLDDTGTLLAVDEVEIR